MPLSRSNSTWRLSLLRRLGPSVGCCMIKFIFKLFAVLVVAAGGLGCSSAKTRPLPDVQADQFHLMIEADWRKAGAGSPIQIVHRLRNESPMPVCVGGRREILVDGRPVKVQTLVDALCTTPLVEIPPGQSSEWRTAWKGLGCWETVSPHILGLVPSRRCGASFEVQSRIHVFRLREHVPQRGVTEITSNIVIVVSSPTR
jgi:hypothetical protein